MGCDGEVSEPLEVNALNCDTVEQLKGKILASFKNKFGFPYCTPIRELCVGELRESSRGNECLICDCQQLYVENTLDIRPKYKLDKLIST